MVKNLEWVEIGKVGEIKKLYENHQLDVKSKEYRILDNDGLYCIYKKDIYPQIIYLGKASHKNGKALYNRLKAYMSYDETKPKNSHDGGKDMWKMKGHEDFHIKVCKCDCCEIMESELLSFYKYLHGNYPPANKQG